MEISYNEKLIKLKKLFKENNISLEDFFKASPSRFKPTSSVYNQAFTDNLTYRDVMNCFEPTKEKVHIRDIGGVEFESETMLLALFDIYRGEVLFENLGKFDFFFFKHQITDVLAQHVYSQLSEVSD